MPEPAGEAAAPAGWAERAADRSPSVQRSRVRSVEQARSIVAAAKRLVAERGSAFTIQELAKEAGVALKTFYRSFESKDQLLLAMLEDEIVGGCEQLRVAAASLPGPVERLRAYVDWIAEAMHTGTDQWRQFVTSEHFRLQQVIPHELAAVNAAFADLLVPEIEAGQRAGVLAPGDPARTAWFVQELVMASFHHYAFAGPPPADIADALWETCSRMLGVVHQGEPRVLSDRKILLTGPAGNIGYPLAGALAQDNEVWGISRFGNPAERAKVDALGVITRSVDLGAGEYGDLPDDFDYVLHLSAFIFGDSYDEAIRVNAEGTALLMQHCRTAKAVLVMSSTGVYRPNPDPWHPFLETEPLGDGLVPGAALYSISKVTEEAVARSVSRMLGIPTIITRMNAAYGNTGTGGLPGMQFDKIRAGEQLVLRWDPNPYSPIHDRDIFEQTEAMLDAASPTCPIVNWGGDEPVAAQEWCALFGELLDVEPDVVVGDFPWSQRGVVLDNTKRMAITGPCRVHWRDGMTEMVQARLANT